MSPSAKPISERLKEIIEDENKTNKGSREAQEQVEDGEEVLNPDNMSSVVNTVLNTTNNQFDHECLDDAVWLLNALPFCQSTADRVPGHNYSFSRPARNEGFGAPGLGHMVRCEEVGLRC